MICYQASLFCGVSLWCLTHFLRLGLFMQHSLRHLAHRQWLDCSYQVPFLNISFIFYFLLNQNKLNIHCFHGIWNSKFMKTFLQKWIKYTFLMFYTRWYMNIWTINRVKFLVPHLEALKYPYLKSPLFTLVKEH